MLMTAHTVFEAVWAWNRAFTRGRKPLLHLGLRVLQAPSANKFH